MTFVPRSLLSAILGLALLGALAGCARPPGGPAPGSLTERQEVALGKVLYPLAVQRLGGALQDPFLQGYVDRVGQAAARGAGRRLPWRFGIVDSPVAGIYALPGGGVLISRELLAELDTEAQLAALLGHAIAHVARRDELAAFRHPLLPVPAVADEAPGFAPDQRRARALAEDLLGARYAIGQERAVDRLAGTALVRAGYAPGAATTSGDLLPEGPAAASGRPGEPALLEAHPSLADDPGPPGSAGAVAGRVGAAAYVAATAAIRDSREGFRLYRRAEQLQRDGRLGPAIATCLQAAAAAPNEPLILAGLGMAYLQAEDLNSARLYLARSVREKPDYYYARLGLGYVYLRQQRIRQAVSELEQSLRLLPSLRGSFLLAQAYTRSGRQAPARVLYRQVVAADPDSALGKEAATRLAALEKAR